MMLLGGASSCTQSIKWDPNFYKASSINESIQDRNENVVMCSEQRFDNFACLHKDKILELAEILERARLPKEDKKQMLKILNGVLKTFK